MKIKLPLEKEKKLTVIFRVEPGCLGPQGETLVDKFCEYAQDKIEPVDAEYVCWVIQARHDKYLPEMEYKINNKKLTHDKAEKYLSLFKKELDVFEGHLQDNLATYIDEFMGH